MESNNDSPVYRRGTLQELGRDKYQHDISPHFESRTVQLKPGNSSVQSSYRDEETHNVMMMSIGKESAKSGTQKLHLSKK